MFLVDLYAPPSPQLFVVESDIVSAGLDNSGSRLFDPSDLPISSSRCCPFPLGAEPWWQVLVVFDHGFLFTH